MVSKHLVFLLHHYASLSIQSSSMTLTLFYISMPISFMSNQNIYHFLKSVLCQIKKCINKHDHYALLQIKHDFI